MLGRLLHIPSFSSVGVIVNPYHGAPSLLRRRSLTLCNTHSVGCGATSTGLYNRIAHTSECGKNCVARVVDIVHVAPFEVDPVILIDGLCKNGTQSVLDLQRRARLVGLGNNPSNRLGSQQFLTLFKREVARLYYAGP